MNEARRFASVEGPMAGTTAFRSALQEALPERPFRVVLWDGSEIPPTSPNGGPTFTARSPQALAHVLRAPGELGLGRAYVSGAIDVDDLDAVIKVVDTWEPPSLDRRTKARLVLAALRATGPVRPPRAPAAELEPKGRFRSIARDSRAVRHHYDLPPEFFRLFLGPTMTYSCAIFSRGATTLEEAQEAKLELVCQKLGLKRGQHVLDVGCGWGSFAIHAAQRHGVRVTGITLSPPQVETAKRRAEEAGVADRTDFRVVDYRELAGESFDAVASIGMVEHVGAERMDEYARRLRGALRPGGQLLNHGIANLHQEDPKPGDFSARYVFPDGAPQPLSRVLLALERAGFENHHIEGFREDYAETLRHWARRLDENSDEAVRIAGSERVRVWRLYLRAARNGFETGFTSIYQVRAS
jgi:cyclopropane-fatty-acyl-phospholipid synthase